MDLKSGVYSIVNRLNKKIYIGSTVNFIYRKWIHFNDPKISSPHLQNAIKKYGIENFEFTILEEIEPIKEKLLEREQYYLDLYKSYEEDKGYNICHIAGSRLGSVQSEETRKKISIGRLGKTKGIPKLPRTKEHTENHRRALLGKKLAPRTEIHKQHIKESWILRRKKYGTNGRKKRGD